MEKRCLVAGMALEWGAALAAVFQMGHLWAWLMGSGWALLWASWVLPVRRPVARTDPEQVAYRAWVSAQDLRAAACRGKDR